MDLEKNPYSCFSDVSLRGAPNALSTSLSNASCVLSSCGYRCGH